MKIASKISAVIITKNEEKYISDCISSILPVVDEVIILDSHSTDNTVKIAKELGTTVLSIKWKGYADTKNLGHTEANHDWILSVDADEVLSPELQRSILDVKQAGLQPSMVYKFNRLNNYCGKWIRHAGWYPDTKIRLFQRDNTYWEGNVHETLHFKSKVKETHLKGDLLHYTISTKEDHLNRLIKYNQLAKPYANRLRAGLAAVTTFLRMYLLKAGFLDGEAGLQLCWVSAKGKWLRV